MATKLLRPTDGQNFDFGGFDVHWKVEGSDTAQQFAIVHHRLAPRALAAPLHYHHNEDELSYVVQGTLGALLCHEVVTAKQGAWVFKPRGQWHTSWNAGDEPCEVIEVISPAGFENYFREIAAARRNVRTLVEINKKYALDVDFDSVPELCRRFNLTFPALD